MILGTTCTAQLLEGRQKNRGCHTLYVCMCLLLGCDFSIGGWEWGWCKQSKLLHTHTCTALVTYSRSVACRQSIMSGRHACTNDMPVNMRTYIHQRCKHALYLMGAQHAAVARNSKHANCSSGMSASFIKALWRRDVCGKVTFYH